MHVKQWESDNWIWAVIWFCDLGHWSHQAFSLPTWEIVPIALALEFRGCWAQHCTWTWRTVSSLKILPSEYPKETKTRREEMPLPLFHIRNESLRPWIPISLANMTFIFLPAVIRLDGKAITMQIVPGQNVTGFLNSVVAILPGSCKSGAQCFPMCHALRENYVSRYTWASSDSLEMLKQFS